MRKDLETFLKGKGFNDSTLAMLNDVQLANLASDYNYKR